MLGKPVKPCTRSGCGTCGENVEKTDCSPSARPYAPPRTAAAVIESYKSTASAEPATTTATRKSIHHELLRKAITDATESSADV